MKLAKKIVFLLFLAILLIVCLFISNKLSSNVHQQQTSYIQSLREKKVLVMTLIQVFRVTFVVF